MLIIPMNCVRDMFELLSEHKSMQVCQMDCKVRTPHQRYIVMMGIFRHIAWQEAIILQSPVISEDGIG